MILLALAARDETGLIEGRISLVVVNAAGAQRAHCHTIEIKGASHSVYQSHAKEVAALIEQAANGASQR